MKRTIAFVFLGLLIYAGIYVMIYGFGELSVSTTLPQELDYMTGTLHNGMVVKGEITKIYGRSIPEYMQKDFLGIPVGERIKRTYCTISVGENPDYMLLAICGEVPNVSSEEPFKFTGVVERMDTVKEQSLVNFLMNNPSLIDAELKPFGMEITAHNRIVPYIVYVREFKGADYSAVIAGAAMTLVGAGLAALLIVKIVRERTGY